MVVIYRSKLRLTIPPESIVNVNHVFKVLSRNYKMSYCGLYEMDDYNYLYVQNKTKMSSNIVIELLKDCVEINAIDSFKEVEGNLIKEKGSIKKPGGVIGIKHEQNEKQSSTQSVVTNNINIMTNNNINVIMVNPIGQESLDHITSAYIQQLLGDTDQDANVVFKFGTKLYSIPENMNFKSSLKVGYVKALLPGSQRAWVTQKKGGAFEMIVENLTEKNIEAVEMYGSDLPKEHLEKFHRNVEWITEFSKSYMPEEQRRYKRFMNEGLNSLSENISDKKRRIERDSNKVLRLT